MCPKKVKGSSVIWPQTRAWSEVVLGARSRYLSTYTATLPHCDIIIYKFSVCSCPSDILTLAHPCRCIYIPINAFHRLAVDSSLEPQSLIGREGRRESPGRGIWKRRRKKKAYLKSFIHTYKTVQTLAKWDCDDTHVIAGSDDLACDIKCPMRMLRVCKKKRHTTTIPGYTV